MCPTFGGRTMCCARAVRRVGYFGPVPPGGQGDRNNYCAPIHRTAQILTQSKNSDKVVFHTENAGLMSKSAVFALRMYASRVVGDLQSGHGKSSLLMGAVRPLCRNAPLDGVYLFVCNTSNRQPIRMAAVCFGSARPRSAKSVLSDRQLAHICSTRDPLVVSVYGTTTCLSCGFPLRPGPL